MTKKNKKKVEEVDISLRGDKFHLFRFKQFLKYLVENDAQIKIYDNDEGFPLKYLANNKRGELGLHHLVAKAVNISEDSARKIIKGPLKRSQFITNTDRVDDLGSTLDDITVLLSGPENSNEEELKFKELLFAYGEGRACVKPYSQILKTSDIDSGGMYTPNITVDNDKILREVISDRAKEFKEGKYRSPDSISCHPSLIQPMTEFLNYYSQANSDIQQRILDEYEEYISIYFSKLNSFDSKNSFLPNYLDLGIIFDKRTSERSLEKYSTVVKQFSEDLDYSEPLKQLEFRYEFLRLFSVLDVNKWGISEQALLLFCNHEMQAVDQIIKELTNTCIESCRFTIHTSNSHNSSKTVVQDLKREKLANVLMYYHINKPLLEVFAVSTNSILRIPLNMYADSYAAEKHYTQSEIDKRIWAMLYALFKKKIITHLNGDVSKLTYPIEPHIVGM